MWVADTVEELYDFFKSLSEEEYNMAIVLQELLIQEISEEESKNLKLAQNMLNNIGVKI